MNRAAKRQQKNRAKKFGNRKNTPSEDDLSEMVRQGIQHHQTGQLKEAIAIYQRILEFDTLHADAHHLLGVIAHQSGEAEKATELILKAIARAPDQPMYYASLGQAFGALGQFPDALSSYRKALDLQPDFAAAHSHMGNILKDSGQFEDAIACYQKALENQPNAPAVLNNLGNAYMGLAQYDNAVASYRKALEFAPQVADLHGSIGNALASSGQISEALGSYRHALEINPELAGIWYNLANLLKESGHPNEAVDHFREAIRIKFDFFEAHNNLGLLLQAAGEFDNALNCYQQALAIKPNSAEVHNNYGNACRDLGHLDGALKSYAQALDINFEFADAHNNLGKALLDMGKVDKALASYRQALRIQPDLAESYRQITLAKTYSRVDDDISSMEKLYKKPTTRTAQKIHLAFGLGKVFDDLEDYDKAFDYFEAGNKLVKSTRKGDTRTYKERFDKIKTVFTPSLFEKYKDAGCSDNMPIFILGMPRSGTSLLEQILASHPDVYGAGELDILFRLLSSQFASVFNPDEKTNLMSCNPDEFQKTGRKYLDFIQKKSPDARFISDKMPLNFQHIGFIKLILPNAKIIHCRRNPMDTCVSLFKSYFPDGGYDYAYDLNDLGRYFSFYDDLMSHWKNVLPGFVHDIEYEKIVTDQDGQTRNLLAYLGLEWDDACLNFHKTSRPVRTASALQVRQPMYSSSIGSWKRYDKRLASLREALGEKL